MAIGVIIDLPAQKKRPQQPRNCSAGQTSGLRAALTNTTSTASVKLSA